MMTQNIEQTVREAFEHGLAGHDAECFDIISHLVIQHGAKPVADAMATIDPRRLIWNSPLRPDETGIGGYPMAGNIYTFCSDVYGHSIDLPDHRDDHIAFAEAAMRAYEDGTIHDLGHVVVHKETGLIGFLLTHRLDAGSVMPDTLLSRIARKLGLPVTIPLRCLAWPNAPGASGRDPAYLAVTAFLTDPGDFKHARDIAVALRSEEYSQYIQNSGDN